MPLNHTHVIYPNFVLEQEIENQYMSKLDLVQFCTVDNTLEGTPGMIKKIRTYSATSATEDLSMGAGNTLNIEVTYGEVDYTILMSQVRFPYYDEELMTDPMAIDTGVLRMSSDMYNHVQAKIMDEFKRTQYAVATGATTTAITFGNFVDAIAMLDVDAGDPDLMLFGLVHPTEIAQLRKTFKTDLLYVEAFIRSGYLGTIAGVNLYAYRGAEKGRIYLATKRAVTLFNKKGTEVEQERDPNTRLNKIYARKYYLPAFTDSTQAVMIIRDVEVKVVLATASVAVAGTLDLTSATYMVKNSGSVLAWKSATPTVATVSQKGIVTGVKNSGTSEVTATTMGGNVYTWTITGI